MVDAVEARLWTPLGLRSLAPGEPGYVAHYSGGVRERDGAYHQGTVWPWLLGPFVEAWVRVRGGTDRGQARGARSASSQPLLAAPRPTPGSGTSPRSPTATRRTTPRGCPFQAWSVGEVLRLVRGVLAPA